MTKDVLAAILETEGGKSGAKGTVMPDAAELTVFVRASGDTISVARIVRVELRDKYVTFHTAKDERFFLAYEDVLGVKTGGPSSGKDRATGFAR